MRRHLAAVVLVVTANSGAAFAERARSAIIIGWDGCQREHLQQLLAKDQVPNLKALAAVGGLVDVTVTTGATDTKAGWTQILTGCRPEVTGVYSNGRYAPIPAGLSIFERVEKAFGDDHVYTAMIVGKKGHVDNDPPRKVPYEQWLKRQPNPAAIKRPAVAVKRAGSQLVVEEGKRYVVTPGKPWSVCQNGMDAFTNGLNANERVGKMAMEAIEANKDRRFLLFVHFARPDHDGHAHGENSPEYDAGVRDDDAWTGNIIRRLKDLGLYKDTHVYVVADHGFDEGLKSHKNAPNVFMATNDTAVKGGGDRADITPTVLAGLGVDIASLSPKLDGRPMKG